MTKPLDLEKLADEIVRIEYPTYEKSQLASHVRQLKLKIKLILEQHLKSACEFYLRYKDNPELFTKEVLPKDIEFRKAEKDEAWDEGGIAYMFYEEGKIYFVFYNCIEEKDDEIIKELVKEFGAKALNDYIALSRSFTMEEFNEWLFKLAFKDVFEESEK